MITFLPAGDPWQKTGDRRVTPAEIRCAMLDAAVEDVEYFEVDRREVDREGPTYTWDTIASFGGDRVVLVLGADAAAGILGWHRGAELAASVELAVARRPGTDPTQVEATGASIRWLEVPEIDLSSTELRGWLGRGFSGRFLIPDAVRQVIAEQRLDRAWSGDPGRIDGDRRR